MTITGINYFSIVGFGGNQTVRVNIPPATVYAQVHLNGCFGGGANYSGIMHYRKRLQSGADQDVDFGAWPVWPPALHDFMSSITFAVTNAAGENQQAWSCARMDFWG